MPSDSGRWRRAAQGVSPGSRAGSDRGERQKFASSTNPFETLWPNRYAHWGLRSRQRAGGLERARLAYRAGHLIVYSDLW